MNKDKRYVFDTNVIVSALLFKKSPPGQVFYRALEQGKILLSLAVAEELNEVLSREKFKRYLLPRYQARLGNAGQPSSAWRGRKINWLAREIFSKPSFERRHY